MLAASRGLATDALAVRYSGEELGPGAGRWPAPPGRRPSVGLVAGAGCVVAGLLLPGSTGAALLGLGLTLPGLLLQDSWRFAFFSPGRARRAFVNDLVWAVVLVPAVRCMVVSGRATVGWFMLAWGGSAGVAAVVGAFQARLVPRATEAVQWLRRHRDLALRYLGESLSLGRAGPDPAHTGWPPSPAWPPPGRCERPSCCSGR